MKRNSGKEIWREKENEVLFSLLRSNKNTNKRRLFISVWGNPNLHVISLFKATNIFYFTNVANIPFVD